MKFKESAVRLLEIEVKLINNRYNVVKSLGKGGMGEVYLIEDRLRENLQLALKMLYVDTVTSAHLEFFKYEFKILTELSHPNLVHVFDYGTTGPDRRHFFTSDFVDGQDLLGGTEGISLEVLYDILVQNLRGLAYIHSRGLIHHDIKVNNILVTSTSPPVVKILDFGLVGEDKVGGEKQPNTVRGTVSYLAPECIRQKQVDHRIDLYALGVTFYFILTRRLPFESNSATEVLRQHILKAPTPIREFNPQVPRELEKIVLKLMEKNREKRYLNANQVLEDLSKFSHIPIEIETKETRESYILSGKFVGRERELAILQEGAEVLLQPEVYLSIEKKEDLPPPFMLVKGSAGVGKSRLIKEFKVNLQLNQYDYFSGEATLGINQAYQPFLSILRTLVPLILERDTPRAKALLEKFGPQLVRLLPEFERAYGLQAETTGDEQQDKTKRLDFVTYFLLEAARIQPMVIALDALQWADEETFDLLDNLISTILLQRDVFFLSRQAGVSLDPHPLSPLLICATLREGELAQGKFTTLLEKLQGLQALSEISLEGLKEPGVEELIRSMIFSSEKMDLWIGELTRATAGNPYFIEQILLYLVEEKKIFPQGDHWHISTSHISSALPQSVQEVLNARLDRLDQEERHALEKLSIHKGEVSLTLFHLLTGLPEEEIHHIFRNLEKKQILQREQKDQEFVYDFLHGITREKIYQDIPKKERALLHYQFGIKLEEAYGQPEEKVEEMAYHFLNSYHPDKAIQYALLAGDKKRSLYANQEALEYYQRGSKLAKTYQSPQQGQFLFKIGEIYTLGGNLKRARQCYESIIALENLSPLERVRARREIADLCKKEGKAEEALKLYQQGIAELESLDEPIELGRLYYSLAEVYKEQGKIDLARESLEKSLQLLQGEECLKERALILNGLAVLACAQGKMEEAIEHHQESLALRKKLGDQEMIATTLLNLGAIYFEQGRVKEAMEHWKESLEIRRLQGNRLGIATVYECLAHCFSTQSDYEKALRFHQKSLDITEKMGAMRTAGHTYSSLAIVHSFLCQWKEAHEYATKSLGIFSKANLKRPLVQSYLALGNIYYHLGDMEKALKHCHQSFEMAQESRHQDGMAQSTLLLSTFYRDQGQLDKAEEFFDKAQAIYNHYENPYSLTFFWMEESRFYLEKEDVLKARSAIDRVRDTLGQILSKWFLVKYHYTSALVYRKEQNPATALRCLKKAVQLAQVVSAKEYLWKAHKEMAEIYVDQKEVPQAKSHLIQAMEIIRDLWQALPDQFKKIYLQHPDRQEVKQFLEKVVREEG